MKVKVSVVMPAHNGSHFIEDSIQSVLTQTLSDLELLVVDDASTDNTVELVNNIAQQDKRVRLIQLPENHGVAFARNAGIQAATGDYVAYLDSDDLWLPNKLELQYALMSSQGLQLTYGSYELIDQDGHDIGSRMISESSLTHRDLLKGNRIGLLSVMLDRKTAVSHQFPEIHHEDYACWLSITREDIVAYRVSTEPLAKYRKHQTSLSANKMQAATWTWHIYRDFEGLNIFKASYYFAHYMIMALTDRR
ncbi:glycosyltransferase family 2 protein [Lacticaseibacillus porcinae]|uniref:glycosyltransferase family 2 protein n=1 Tax=Lacticaseibacillus porcinae TaxID=1123687 RepID=UPI001CDBA635|nr:glycosyltransferase family 2 protein [Lacticaseibacillus porcinae]